MIKLKFFKEAQETIAHYVLSALFGITGALITICTIILLNLALKFVWEDLLGNNLHSPERTVYIPVVILASALLIALISLKNNKPISTFDEVIKDILVNGKIQWRNTPHAFLTAFFSIAGGASLGPEAPAVFTTAGTTSALTELTKRTPLSTQIINLASTSGMLGSLLGSPFLLPTLIAETAGNKLKDLRNFLTYSLIGSIFGIGTFYFFFTKLYVSNLGIPPYSGDNFYDLMWSFGLGLVGAILAGICFISIEKLITKMYSPIVDRFFIKLMVGAILFSMIAFLIPLSLFSGLDTTAYLISKSAELSFWALVGLAVIKIFSTILLLKSGFYGGSIFPTFFAGVALGLAFGNLFSLPPTLAITAVAAGMLTAIFKAPFSAAVLTIALVGTTSTITAATAAAGGSLVLVILSQITGAGKNK